jgi:GNAT superfamily N-acetyltransferase
MIDPICYLQDLFTVQAARGKGVGRALIEGVYHQAMLAGCPRVYWQTHETNRCGEPGIHHLSQPVLRIRTLRMRRASTRPAPRKQAVFRLPQACG